MFSKKAASLYISNAGVEAVVARASGNKWAVESFARGSGKGLRDPACQAIEGAGIKKGAICASIPDTSAHAIILDFEEFPENRREGLELVRFKAGRFLNLPLSGQAAGYHVISRDNGVRVFAVVPRKELISELGGAAAEKGLELGRVSLHSINLVNHYFSANEPGVDSFAVLVWAEEFFTVMFFNNGVLDFYRCREAGPSNEEGSWKDVAATFLSYRGRRQGASSRRVYLFEMKGGACAPLKKAAGDREIIPVKPETFIENKGSEADAFHIMAALGAAIG